MTRKYYSIIWLKSSVFEESLMLFFCIHHLNIAALQNDSVCSSTDASGSSVMVDEEVKVSSLALLWPR